MQRYSVFPRYEVVFQVNAHACGKSNKKAYVDKVTNDVFTKEHQLGETTPGPKCTLV